MQARELRLGPQPPDPAADGPAAGPGGWPAAGAGRHASPVPRSVFARVRSPSPLPLPLAPFPVPYPTTLSSTSTHPERLSR